MRESFYFEGITECVKKALEEEKSRNVAAPPLRRSVERDAGAAAD
jgi:hypothetical protein